MTDEAGGSCYRHHWLRHIPAYISPDSTDNWSVSLVRCRKPWRAANRESLPDEVRGKVCGGTSSTRQFTPNAIYTSLCNRFIRDCRSVVEVRRHSITRTIVVTSLASVMPNADASLVLTSACWPASS